MSLNISAVTSHVLRQGCGDFVESLVVFTDQVLLVRDRAIGPLNPVQIGRHFCRTSTDPRSNRNLNSERESNHRVNTLWISVTIYVLLQYTRQETIIVQSFCRNSRGHNFLYIFFIVKSKYYHTFFSYLISIDKF